MDQDDSTARPFTVVDRRFSANPDASDDDGESPRKPSYVEELEQKLEESERRLQETLAQHRRAAAEFEDARARLSRDLAREVETHRRSVLADFLEVLDNLDRALDAAAGSDDREALRQGVAMVREQFLGKLAGMGVERVESLDAPFDPTRHDAVSVVPVDDPARDGRVLGVIREAYVIGGEVLRPAMVAVGRCDAAAGEARAGSEAAPVSDVSREAQSGTARGENGGAGSEAAAGAAGASQAQSERARSQNEGAGSEAAGGAPGAPQPRSGTTRSENQGAGTGASGEDTAAS